MNACASCTQVTVFPVREANRALNDLKSGRVNGVAILERAQ
jgi:hypothetical protein